MIEMSFENMKDEELIESSRNIYLLVKNGKESLPFAFKTAFFSSIITLFFMFGFKEPNIIHCLISLVFSIFTITFFISLNYKSKRYLIIYALMIKELHNRGYDVICGETLTILRLK